MHTIPGKAKQIAALEERVSFLEHELARAKGVSVKVIQIQSVKAVNPEAINYSIQTSMKRRGW